MNGFERMELVFQDESEDLMLHSLLVHNHYQETYLLLTEWHKTGKKRAPYTPFSLLWEVASCVPNSSIMRNNVSMKDSSVSHKSSLFKPSVLRVHWEDVNLNFFYFSLADTRHAVVEVDNVSLAAKLVDLPCVIGSLKTLDRKSFYKTADVSQVWTSFLNLFTLIPF